MLHLPTISTYPHFYPQPQSLPSLPLYSFPSGNADIRFTFPVQSSEEEELRLNFNWEPAYMSELNVDLGADDATTAMMPSGRYSSSRVLCVVVFSGYEYCPLVH